MRVTKRIEQYIFDEVRKAYPMPEAIAEHQQRRRQFDETLRELKERVKDYAKDLVKACAEANPEAKELELDNIHTYIYYKKFEGDEEIRELEKTVRAKWQNITENICVALELGAKKDEIPQLIAAAIAENNN